MSEATRSAVVSPYLANWLLAKVPAEVWRWAVEGGRLSDSESTVRDLVQGRAQLEAATTQWRSVLESGVGFADETVEAKQALGGRESGCPPFDPASTGQFDSSQVAELVGASPQWVGKLAKRGVLRGRLEGRRWLIERDSVAEYLNEKGREVG